MSAKAGYRQVAAVLRSQIIRGVLPPGELLPSERELMEHFSLARATIRQAMQLLENEGLVATRQGLGRRVIDRGVGMEHPQDLSDPITRADMKTVIVEKARLQRTLTENRAAHREAFERALAGYRARAIELLEEHIERIRNGKVELVLVSLPAPADHTDDYDRAILTLEWTVFEQVELTIGEFDMYVRDCWRWSQEFLSASRMYS